MINYLKSEIYRMTQMKSTYLIPIVLILFLYAMLGFVWISGADDPSFPYNHAGFIFLFVHSSLTVVSFIIPFIVHTIFADEYTNGTFKNSISYGTNRKILYFGKLILMVAYSLLVMTFITILFVIGTNVIMESGTTADRESQQAFINAIFHATPAFLSLLIFSHMLSFVVKKTSSHWVIYFLVVIAYPTVLSRLQFGIGNRFLTFLLNLTPMNLLITIGQSGMKGELVEWQYLLIVFLIYAIISTVIGLQSFSKKDI